MTPRLSRTKRITAVSCRGLAASAKALRRSEELADTFKMLGNANRLKIVVYLDEQERSVGDIEAALEIHQPTLSQQLGELRDAGLIVGRKVAKTVIYALTPKLGRRALETIYLANGHAPRAEAQLPPRNPPNQAAVFASVLSARGSQVAQLHPGFKSLLRE